MIIANPAERMARAAAKRVLVLKYLCEEVWSTAANIGAVAGLRARQPAERLLASMERDGLVRHARAPVLVGRGMSVWGITAAGRAACRYADPLGPIFEPSKLALTTVPHTLALQAVRLRCEAAGWSEWTRGERLGQKLVVRPDAVVSTPQKVRVALEIERTIKTPRRYLLILSAHLRAIQHGSYSGVYYVAPSSIARGLERIFEAIRLLPGGIPFDEGRRKRFRVVVCDDFPERSSQKTV